MNPKTKFLIAGGSNTAITFALYTLLVHKGFDYNLALIIVYPIGIVFGFLINRLWTFANGENVIDKTLSTSRAKPTSTQFVQYVLVYALIFSVNFAILNLLVQAFKFDPIMSQLIAIAFSTVCSYFLQKSWVFKP